MILMQNWTFFHKKSVLTPNPLVCGLFIPVHVAGSHGMGPWGESPNLWEKRMTYGFWLQESLYRFLASTIPILSCPECASLVFNSEKRSGTRNTVEKWDFLQVSNVFLLYLRTAGWRSQEVIWGEITIFVVLRALWWLVRSPQHRYFQKLP